MLKKELFLLTAIGVAFSVPMTAEATCYPTVLPPTQISGYVPFTFVNSYSNITSSQVFVTMSAQTANGEYVFITFNNMGIGATVGAGPTTPPTYFYSLADLPTYMGSGYVYVPVGLTNGEIYIGVDYAVTLNTLHTTTTGPFSWSIVTAAGATDNTNANYYHLYDSMKFTTNQNQLTLILNMDNEYGLSLTAAVGANTSHGIPLNTFFLGLPPTVPRDGGTTSVLGSYSNNVSLITNTASRVQWAGLTVTVQGAGNISPTNLRMFSPKNAMTFSLPQSSPNQLFDPSYLFNDVYADGSAGSNWFNKVWGMGGFYNGGMLGSNELYLDVSALHTPTLDYKDYLLNSAVVATGLLSFVSDAIPAPDAIVSSTSSLPYFNGSFPNKSGGLALPLVINYLTEGFCTGILPANFTASNPLTQAYFAAVSPFAVTNSPFWGGNPNFASIPGGPWYDLYSATLHRLAPFSPTNNYSNFQADGADSPLGFYQPVKVSLNSMPYVAIILGDMAGTILPDFTDPTPYSVLFAPGANTVYHVQGQTITGPSSLTLTVGLPITLTVSYTGASGAVYTGPYPTQIWFNGTINSVNYSIAYPQTPAGTPATAPTGPASHWRIGAGAPNP
jgi:hypothetical protein